MKTQQEMLAALTENERQFLKIGVWSSVAEAYAYAKENRPDDFIDAKKLSALDVERITKMQFLLDAGKIKQHDLLNMSHEEFALLEDCMPLLMHLNLNVDEGFALRYSLDELASSPVMENLWLILTLKKMAFAEMTQLTRHEISQIGELSLSLVKGQITAQEALAKVSTEKVRKAFVDITPEDISFIREHLHHQFIPRFIRDAFTFAHLKAGAIMEELYDVSHFTASAYEPGFDFVQEEMTHPLAALIEAGKLSNEQIDNLSQKQFEILKWMTPAILKSSLITAESVREFLEIKPSPANEANIGNMFLILFNQITKDQMNAFSIE